MKVIGSILVGLVLMLIGAGCSVQPPTDTAVMAPPSSTPGTATEPFTATAAADFPETASDAISELPLNLDGFVDLTPDQLHEILPEHKFTLVNVHIPYEGELPDTDLSIPYNQIADHRAELPAKDAPIVLYCRTGPMSTQAAKTLVGLGYTHIYELDGGFDAWAAANYELLKKQ